MADTDQDTVQDIVDQRRTLLAAQPSEPAKTTDASSGIPRQKQQLSPQPTDNSGLSYSAVPQLKQYNAPYPQKDEYSSTFDVFKDPMVVLAGLSSLFTRRPLVGAMNYAAGAMKGYHQGQKDVFDQNKEKFDEAIKATIEQNKIELNRYNVAWDRRKEFNWQKVAPELYAQAAANNDTLLQAAIKSGNWDLVEKIIVGRETAQTRLQTAVQAETEKMQAKEEQVNELQKDPNVIARAKAISNYEQPGLPTSGFASNNPYNQAVMSLVTKMGQDSGEPYEAANYGAKNKFVTGLGAVTPGSPGGRVNAINTVVRHFNTLDRIIDDLGSKDTKTFNRAAQALQVEFGLSSAPTNFDVARGIVANEMVKAVVNSGGGVTDRLSAQAEFDRATSPKLLHDAVNTAKELIGGQMQSLVDQAHAVRAEKQFDRALPTSTRQALTMGQSRTGPVRVQTPAEAQKLPPGTHYVTPDGREFVR